MKRIKSLLSFILVAALLATTTSAAVVGYGEESSLGETTYDQSFSDIPPEHWAFTYIEELAKQGAINGYPDGKFYPDKTVTREEFAKIMVVAAGLTASPAVVSSYADVPLTYWASPFIETARPYMTAYKKWRCILF